MPFDPFGLGWGATQQQAILNGLPPGQQFIVAGPKGEKLAAVSTPSGIQVSQTPLVEGAAGTTAGPKLVVKQYDDGSMHAVTVEPDGTITDEPLTSADNKVGAKTDAQTAWYQSRADQVAAMAAVNPQLAQARADRLNQQIAADTALTPAKIQNLQQSAAAKFSQVGLNAAKAGQATAMAGKIDAQTGLLLDPIHAKMQAEIARIQSDQTFTDQQKKDEIQKTVDTAIAETQSTLSDAQKGIGGATGGEKLAADTAQRAQDMTQATTQGDNRATTAASYFGNTLNEVGKLNSSLPVGSDLGGKGFLALMRMAPNFQASMGGAPQASSGLSGPQQAAMSMAQGLAAKYNIPIGQAAQHVTNMVTGQSSPDDVLNQLGPDALPSPGSLGPSSPSAEQAAGSFTGGP